MTATYARSKTPNLPIGMRCTSHGFDDSFCKPYAISYAGVLADVYEKDGSPCVHFWVYPTTPPERLDMAVKAIAHLTRSQWHWDVIPQEHLHMVLHQRLRELLLSGSKDSHCTYVFHPETVILMGEILDAYRATWPELSKAPGKRHKLLTHSRKYALQQRKKLLEEWKDTFLGANAYEVIMLDDPAFYVDVQAIELADLLQISNRICAEEDGPIPAPKNKRRSGQPCSRLFVL